MKGDEFLNLVFSMSSLKVENISHGCKMKHWRTVWYTTGKWNGDQRYIYEGSDGDVILNGMGKLDLNPNEEKILLRIDERNLSKVSILISVRSKIIDKWSLVYMHSVYWWSYVEVQFDVFRTPQRFLFLEFWAILSPQWAFMDISKPFCVSLSPNERAEPL